MPWTYNINPTLQIVEVAYTGNTTARDLQESTSAFIALEKKEGINRFLIDTSEMELTASIMDVYNLPDKQYLEEEAERSGRVALILPTSAREKEAVNFYETVCKNRGWQVKTFLEHQEAVNWLTPGTASKKPDASDGL